MLNILIVDDQPHLLELFSEELMDEGYKTQTASDIESAKDYFRNSVPDLVLLDLYLNGFQGSDLLDEIKGQHPQLPVLIVTAYDNYMNDPRLSKADGYIVKNFDAIECLKNKIADIIFYENKSLSHVCKGGGVLAPC